MIYFVTKQGQAMIILEPGNIEKVKRGEPLVTPDRSIIVTYTPDIEWMQEQILARAIEGKGSLEAAALDALLKEGLRRPEVHRADDPPMRNVMPMVTGKGGSA